jgi:hypothetical protein
LIVGALAAVLLASLSAVAIAAGLRHESGGTARPAARVADFPPELMALLTSSCQATLQTRPFCECVTNEVTKRLPPGEFADVEHALLGEVIVGAERDCR